MLIHAEEGESPVGSEFYHTQKWKVLSNISMRMTKKKQFTLLNSLLETKAILLVNVGKIESCNVLASHFPYKRE